MNVLCLALGGNRPQAVRSDLEHLLDSGADVTLVTLRRDRWKELDPRVGVIEIASAEGRHPLPRLERQVVFRGPAAVFRVLRRLVGRLATRRGGSRPARLAMRGVAAGQAAWERGARAFHKRVFLRLYGTARPWILWRVSRRLVLPRVDLARTDLVLVMDSQSIPLGWHIARDHPDLDVSFSLDRGGGQHIAQSA